jgi:hypothetical protein
MTNTPNTEEPKKMKPTAILRAFFNTPGDPEGYEKKGAADFLAEIKQLSPEDKAELVDLAAKEMGVEITLT